MKRISFWTAVLAAMVVINGPAASFGIELTVEAGDVDRVNVPVRAMVTVPKTMADAKSAIVVLPGQQLVGQLTAPCLLATPVQTEEGTVVRELHFVLPKLAAGKTATYSVVPSNELPSGATTFKWYDKPKQYNTLMFGRRPIMVYMYAPLDESTKQAREKTYKVFHHVYDPAGKQIVTKGAGGRYSHHRGIFYGFNRITYAGNKRVDTWHCTGDTHQSHEGFLASEEGPVLGRHLVAVDWHGISKEVFAKEERELTVYNIPGGQMIEFASRLRSAGPKIELRGDPQHAGFQFRASNEVDEKTKEQTYYLRPDGKGRMGGTRNWPGQKNHANLPWNAMSFVVGGQRYTCCYLDRPENPKEARYSERDYGRFGSYFEYDLDKTNKLDINYRIWLQEGEMTVDAVAALSANFVTAPKVTVK